VNLGSNIKSNRLHFNVIEPNPGLERGRTNAMFGYGVAVGPNSSKESLKSIIDGLKILKMEIISSRSRIGFQNLVSFNNGAQIVSSSTTLFLHWVAKWVIHTTLQMQPRVDC